MLRVHVPRQARPADRSRPGARQKRETASALAARCWRCGTEFEESTLEDLRYCFELARQATS